MTNWFECKSSYEKTLENGTQKKVSEPYLMDALSFTEAEARFIEEIRPFISGEFTVTDIKRARISEIFFNENGDRFYKIKVYFITFDAKNGTEKKTSATMIAQASTLEEAIEVLKKGMKGTVADYTIASVSETAIMDIFPYSADTTELIAVIEKSENNYSAYIKNVDLAITSTGKTIDEVKDGIRSAIEVMKDECRDYGYELPKELAGKYEIVFEMISKK